MPVLALMPLLRMLWRFLTVGITVPLGLIIAVPIWFHFDKASDARHAVDRAVKELVAGAELKAAEAKAKALQAIVDDERRKAADLKAANERYAKQAAEDDLQIGNLNDQISELMASPVSDTCTVDAPLAGRLRNR